MIQFKIEDIEKGVIPQELNTITAQITDVLKFSRRVRAYLAVLITQARRKYFKNDVTGWIDWCKEQGVADADIHPLRQTGDLLLDILPHDLELYERLFLLDTDKSRAIGRLKTKVTVKLTLIDVVQKFLAAYPPEKLNREKVRRCIAFCLGEVDSPDLPEELEKAKNSKYQPTLWDSLDALVGKNARDYEDIAVSKDFNAGRAHQCAMGGIGMLTASTTYWKTHACELPGDNILEAIAKELHKEADNLMEIINNNANLKVG